MPDFNDATKLGSGKEMVERLTNLIAIFENKALDFSKNRADGDDILGDAYEYLIKKFADAMDDRNPLYWDEEYAGNSRFGSIIAPPGFFGWPSKWARGLTFPVNDEEIPIFVADL